MNEILSWAVPLLATGLVGLVVWVVRLAVLLTELKAANTAIQKDLETHVKYTNDHIAWNHDQHEDLYTSRNNMSNILERLTTLFEGMDKKQDAMDRKLDMLIERRSNPR